MMTQSYASWRREMEANLTLYLMPRRKQMERKHVERNDRMRFRRDWGEGGGRISFRWRIMKSFWMLNECLMWTRKRCETSPCCPPSLHYLDWMTCPSGRIRIPFTIHCPFTKGASWILSMYFVAFPIPLWSSETGSGPIILWEEEEERDPWPGFQKGIIM